MYQRSRGSYSLLAGFLAVVLLLPPVAEARDLSSREFGRLVERATKKTNEKDRVDLKGGGYTPVSELEDADSNAPGEAVKFTLRQHAYTGGGSVLIRGGQAVLQNHGTSAAYAFRMPLPPTISPQWAPRMLQKKGLAKVSKILDGYHDGVSGSVSFEDGFFWITARYEYGKGNDYKVSDTFRDLMMDTRYFIEAVYKGEKEARKDYWKAVEKSPVTSLDNPQMFAVFEEDLSDYGEQSEGAGTGRFSWWGEGKRDMEVLNNGDELILAQRFPVKAPAAVRAQVATDVTDLLAAKKDRRLPGAERMEAVFDPGDGTLLSVRAIYPLAAGAYTGKDLRKAYETYDGDFSKKLYKDVTKIIGQAGKRAWEARRGQTPTYLSKADLLYLAPWDIAATEGAMAGATEGFWKWEEDGTPVELWNTGEVLTIGFWHNLPDGLSQEQTQRILARLNDKLGDDDVAHAGGPSASLYPGYDQVVWVAVRLPMGSYTNEQIREVLHVFADQYCHKADKTVGKVIDKET